MSEYQFYEFLCIDNRLTAKERKEIAAWSSRIGLTTAGAIFTYNYSDFPIDPVEATARYFDAMFYINNRKTRWLFLKFPADLVDRKVIESYCSVEEISVLEYDKYLILDIGFCDDESDGWVDGEGVLASIIDLRQDILKGMEAEYRQNIREILQTYSRLSALKAKIIFAGLT